MESICRTVLALLVMSSVSQQDKSSRDPACVPDLPTVQVKSRYTGYAQDNAFSLTCKDGLVPSNFSGLLSLECSSGVWYSRAEKAQVQLKLYQCQEPPVFTLWNVSATADTISLRGHLGNYTSSAKLSLQLSCSCYRPQQPGCPTSREITSPAQLYQSSGHYSWTCQQVRPYCQHQLRLAILYTAAKPQHHGDRTGGHSYRQPGGREELERFSVDLHTQLVNTTQAVPVAPTLIDLDLEHGRVQWEPSKQCGCIVQGYQVIIYGWKGHTTASLAEEINITLNGSTYQLMHQFKCATLYNVTVRARSVAGWGSKLTMQGHTKAEDPAIPRIQGLVPEIIDSTAVVHIEPVSSPCTVVILYQVIVMFTRERAAIGAMCRGPLRGFDRHHPDQEYISLQLPVANVTQTVAVTIGEGNTKGGFFNKPLELDRSYTLVLRVVSQWAGEKKFVCAAYKSFYTSSGRMAKLVSSLLIIALLISLLMFLAHRRWGQKLQRPREQALTPLIRTRPGVSTEVGVSKLLDVMVKMKLFNDNSDDEDGEADGLTMEYRNLSNYPLHSCSVAQDPHNASKSRYLTILPYDNSRVVLKDGSSGDGFINASYIDGYRKPNYYIATQGPLAETVGDFWSMVWQEHCNLIVMLTKLNEQGKPKCDRYLPKRGRETFGQFTVTRVSATSPATQEFTSSTLRLQQVGAVDGSSREVQHLHYLQWPDHGVPSNTISIYRLLKHIHQSSHNTRHMLVHCSAGVGRTGTFIAIDYLLKMAEAEEKVDVFRCVDHMRGQRAGMVQTQEQYRFIYQVLLDVQEFGDTAIAVEHFPDCVRSLLTGEQGLPSLGCKREFESLQQFCRLYDSQTSTEAQRPCNLPKNRSPHILPGDRVRPSLVSVRNGDGSAGYINAIYTERHGVRDGFILTQLPLPHTLPDFWALVYDHDCMTVVSMNHPHQLDQSYVSLCGAEGCGQYGPFEVKERSVSVSSNITERLLIVRRHGQSCEREVRVLQLDNWPMDEPVPASPRTILSLDQRVQTWQQQHKYKPIVITCWDGAARSGLYCAASNLCQQIRRQRMVDVFQTVRTVRRSRPQALASLDQYGFCYRLAKDYLEQATASKEVAGAAEAGTADRDGDAPQ